MLVSSLPMKIRTTLAGVVVNTFATPDGLAHDVTDTEYWAQNGSAHGQIFSPFKRNLIFNKQDKKLNENCRLSLCPQKSNQGCKDLPISPKIVRNISV